MSDHHTVYCQNDSVKWNRTTGHHISTKDSIKSAFQITNYDKLIMEFWTDGSLNPEEAVTHKINSDNPKTFSILDKNCSQTEKYRILNLLEEIPLRL